MFQILYEIRETKGLPWIASPTLGSNVAEGLRMGLRSITNMTVLGRLRNDTTGFESVSDEDYNSIRDAMEAPEEFEHGFPKQPSDP